MTQATRLVLPVTELASTVPGAHIDLLAPFLPLPAIDDGVLGELAAFFASLTPFPFVLGDPTSFPSGERYLPPRPVGAFRRITLSLRRTFPEVADPRQGPATPLDAVVPHLPLPEGVELATPREVHAREALLLDGPVTVARFGFGTSAA